MRTKIPTAQTSLSASDEEESRPDATLSPNETVTEALLVRHIMADKLPADEPTNVFNPGSSSLLAADIEETSTEAEMFRTLPFSAAVRDAVNARPKGSSSKTFKIPSFTKRTAYQPSTTEEDPDPMRLTNIPQDEPGWEELTRKKVNTTNVLQATTFSSSEVRELWLAARTRLAISSTQDWMSAAIHRAIAHVSSQLPTSPENEEIHQQLDGIRHLLCFLGKTIEDGFGADAEIASQVTTATRKTALKQLPDLMIQHRRRLWQKHP